MTVRVMTGFYHGMTENDFRKACEKACARYPALPRLQSVAAVGAYAGEFGGADVDSDRLTKGLIYIAQSGFLISPDFKVDVVNFLYERNFLKEDASYDMAFISYIIEQKPYPRQFAGMSCYDRNMPKIREQLSKAANPSDFLDRSLGGVMCPTHSPDNWRKRALMAGAKIIYTHGGKGEIGTHTFRPDFEVLIASPALNKNWVGDYERHLDVEDRTVREVHGLALDIPLAWSGFSARKDYIQDIFPALGDKKTSLAMTVRELALKTPNLNVDKRYALSL